MGVDKIAKLEQRLAKAQGELLPFVETGQEFTVYRAEDGKPKKVRTYWVDGELLCWAKSKSEQSHKPTKFPKFLQVGSLRTPSGDDWFDIADHKGVGSIDAQRLNWLYNKACKEFLTPDKLQEAMHLIDTDKNGTVSRDEFVCWWEMDGPMKALEYHRSCALTIICERDLRLHLVPKVNQPTSREAKAEMAKIAQQWIDELHKRGAKKVDSVGEKNAKDRRLAKAVRRATKVQSIHRGNSARALAASLRAQMNEEVAGAGANLFTSSGIFKAMCKKAFVACASEDTKDPLLQRDQLYKCIQILYKMQYCMTLTAPDEDKVQNAANELRIGTKRGWDEAVFIQLATIVLGGDIAFCMAVEISVLLVALLAAAVAAHYAL